jgi:hypothetical protein
MEKDNKSFTDKNDFKDCKVAREIKKKHSSSLFSYICVSGSED